MRKATRGRKKKFILSKDVRKMCDDFILEVEEDGWVYNPLGLMIDFIEARQLIDYDISYGGELQEALRYVMYHLWITMFNK